MDNPVEFSLYRPKPSDLPAFLPFACGQLEAPFHLRMLVETVEAYVSKSEVEDKIKKSARDKTTPQVHQSTSRYSTEKEASGAMQDYGDGSDIVIRTRCDRAERPVELLFCRCVQVPRLLMKIIGLCIPYHEQLARITIRRVPLDGAVLYEIAKFLPLSQLTELCLDDSPAQPPLYHLLLERPSRLRGLSLARCRLGDEECALLAARLAPPQPAARSLALLSLEANRISDAGARALGDALRTNRALRHLNLAGNAIGPLGAASILRSLARFPMTPDEILIMRRRTFDYLKLRQEVYSRCYRELTQVEPAVEPARGRRRTVVGRSRRGSTATLTSVKSSGVDALEGRVEAMVAEVLGAYCEPLEASELETLGGVVYCAGNFSLNYLNLAYNNLDCTSARRLAEVLQQQARAARRSGTAAGLLRAVLEGNALDAASAAARTAGQLLARTLDGAEAAHAQHKAPRKSERPKFK